MSAPRRRPGRAACAAFAVLAAFAVVIASLATSATARAQEDEDEAAAPDTTAAPTEPANPRTLLSTDGAVRVYEELRPGEGIDGFWWEYDPQADLTRLLDDDRRGRPLDKLTDAFGFQVFAPESILALRDSVKAVADSIRAKRIDVGKRFDPKLTSRYTENRDNYDFVNELTSPIPLRWGTLQTTVTNRDSFNESTRKVRDGRTLSSAFSHRFPSGVSTSLSLNRADDQQRRDEVIESRSHGTSVNGRVVVDRSVDGLGDLSAEAGLAGSRNTYETEVTDGQSDQFSPSWGGSLRRNVGTGKVSLGYQGKTDRGQRVETRAMPEGEQRSEAEDDNLSNRFEMAADGKVSEIWTFRVNGSLARDRIQFIAQADSVAGRQETRRNESENLSGNIEAKPFDGLRVKLDARTSRNEFNYVLESAKFNETTSRSGNAEVAWDPRSGTKFLVRLGREREDRNFLTAQAGIVDKESANVNWKQTVTPKVEFTANYDVTLDSFVFDDKVQNTGDRDLRNQRSIFTVRYDVNQALNTSVRMDIRKAETVNVNPQKSRENKTDYAYLITPDYTLRFAGNNITGEFSADARYAVFDFDEDRNFLTRRFSTRQRWQRALTERVSSEVLGTYEISDEGAYRPSEIDGVRRFARSRETHRFRIETQMLYNPRSWLQFRSAYRRDGDDEYAVSRTGKQRSGRFRTDEITFGTSGKKRFMRAVLLDVDVSWTQKDGDRVTEVDRRFYNIRVSLEYQPMKQTKEGQS